MLAVPSGYDVLVSHSQVLGVQMAVRPVASVREVREPLASSV